jgi:hypothetical protein
VKNWHVMSAELRAMSAWPPMEPVIVYGAQRAAGRSSRGRGDESLAAGLLNGTAGSTNKHRARRARPRAHEIEMYSPRVQLGLRRGGPTR